MLFDRPASLPTAAIHTSTFAGQLRGQRARAAGWVRPRLVPLAVAVFGMLALLGATNYLTQLARYTPPTVTAPVAHDPAAGQIRVIVITGQ